MGEYYSVAIPEDKKVYRIGTISSARHVLPLLLKEVILEKEYEIYHDGGASEDKYEEEMNFEIIYHDSYPLAKAEWVESNALTADRFYEIKNKSHENMRKQYDN